jgi:hypothetical protein
MQKDDVTHETEPDRSSELPAFAAFGIAVQLEAETVAGAVRP